MKQRVQPAPAPTKQAKRQGLAVRTAIRAGLLIQVDVPGIATVQQDAEASTVIATPIAIV